MYTGKYWIFERDRSRATPDEDWPWETMEPEEWKKLRNRSIKVTCFIILVENPLFVLGTGLLNMPDVAKTDIESMPTPVQLLAQWLFCLIIEDFLFFAMHYIMHFPWFYKRFHKVHHEHKVTFSLAAVHFHPVEYITGAVVPSFVGPMLLGPLMHRCSAFGWYAMRSWCSIEGHSGYQLRWNPYRLLPFQNRSPHHFYHHTANQGNYSDVFHIWDTIFGTSAEFHKHLDNREKQVKQD